MQIDPMKPVLKPPGSMHLEPRYYGSLSNFGFNSNLRRCIEAEVFG